MYQFFVEDEQVQQDRICIVGGDVNHIGHVLRMKTGEKIRISDQSGRSYFCRILEITEENSVPISSVSSICAQTSSSVISRIRQKYDLPL